MINSFKPRRVSDRLLQINITGYLMPWKDDHPVWLQMPGLDDLFLPIFETRKKLGTLLIQKDIFWESVKQIDDQAEFLASIPPTAPDGTKIRFAVDPWMTSEGTVRYLEIFRPGSPID